MDKDFIDELIELEAQAGGVLSYTPLVSKLEECGDDVSRKREVAISDLPTALLCAIQDTKCLNDIREVAKQYPDFVIEIVQSDRNLRQHPQFSKWMDYESDEYKCFIKELESGLNGRDKVS